MDAVITGRRRHGRIVHVANFDIVLSACQELDEFHSFGSDRAPGCKDLDFSPLRHPALITLSGHRLSGLYRAAILAPDHFG